MSLSEEEQRQWYEALKQLPDFDCIPLPSSWYKKFNIPPRNPVSTKEFIASGYTMKCAVAPKDLPSIVIDKPIKDGLLVEVAPPEEIPVEIKSRPFVAENVPAILPSLRQEGYDKLLTDDTHSSQAEQPPQ